MGRKNNVIEELLELLYEATGLFWQIGFTISLIFGATSIFTLRWAIKQSQHIEDVLRIQDSLLSYLPYGVPVVSALLCWIFGMKAYLTYTNSQHG